MQLSTIADPVPRPGEALVELRAVGINRRDLLIRSGIADAYRFPLPLVLGSDGAGIRRDTGEQVVILPSLDWGPSDRIAGPDFQILGGPRDGTYAELVAVPEVNLFPRPAGFSWTESAALPLASLTAYRALVSVGELKRDERLVVLGVGSGVSMAAIQLGIAIGARVAVTSSSEDKIGRAIEVGADVGIDYRDEDWPRLLAEAAGPADVVLDSVGSTWQHSMRLLARGGRLVACGATGGGSVEFDVRSLYLEQKQILGTMMGSDRDFGHLLDLVQAGDVRPVIDSVHPLAEASSAHRRLETGGHFGKLVLEVC